MGCASSITKHGDNNKIVIPATFHSDQYNSRETRIIQAEEVDIFIDDEYDEINNDWMYCSGNYQLAELNGEWKTGISAGGSRNDLESFSTNPQILLSVGPKENHRSLVESYYSEENKFNKIMISVCLEQNEEKPLAHVAYFIYKTDKEERLSAEYFLVVPPEGDTGAFVNWRQLRHEFRLSPGLYVIIPATFLPNVPRKFTLTVQTFPPFYIKELTKCDQTLQ